MYQSVEFDRLIHLLIDRLIWPVLYGEAAGGTAVVDIPAATRARDERVIDLFHQIRVRVHIIGHARNNM